MYKVLVILACLLIGTLSDYDPDRVRYKKIGSINFSNGKQTIGRPISRSQLQCVKGDGDCIDGCSDIQITSMNCKQKLSSEDSNDIAWKCTAFQLDKKKYFVDKASVICEGWDYPNDRYVSRQSCYVQYHACRYNITSTAEITTTTSEPSSSQVLSREPKDENAKRTAVDIKSKYTIVFPWYWAALIGLAFGCFVCIIVVACVAYVFGYAQRTPNYVAVNRNAQPMYIIAPQQPQFMPGTAYGVGYDNNAHSFGTGLLGGAAIGGIGGYMIGHAANDNVVADLVEEPDGQDGGDEYIVQHGEGDFHTI